MAKKLESIAMFTCRSPYVDSSKIYCPMANLVLKSYVNTYLPDVDVEIVDDDYDTADLSRFSRFDAVGVSVMTPQRKEAEDLATAFKQQLPGTRLIMGGPHVTNYFVDVMNHPVFDHIVAGDGEKALVAILNGTATDKVVMVGGMSKDEILTAPRPDRTSANAIDVISRYNYKLGGRNSTTMMTARGCTEHCKFCEDARTNVRWTGYESINSQLDDIKGLGFNGVYVFDDLFAIAMPKVKPIVEAMSARDIIFRCNGQARYFTKWGEDFAKLLADNGCYEIAFGHESGSQLILDSIEKRTTVEQNYKSVEYAKKHGIIVKSFILIGLPGETRQTLADTERFIATAGIDDAQVAIYYPYKGTAIRDAIDRGETVQDFHFSGEGLGAYGQKGGKTEAVVRTSELSQEDLLDFRDYLVKTYKPQSHDGKKTGDQFFDTHMARNKK